MADEEALLNNGEVTEVQRYLFDLRGYIVVPNALTPEQVAAANAAITQRLHYSPEWLKDSTNCRMGYCTSKSFFSDEDGGRVFRDLINNPHIMPFLREAIGGHRLRLDHDYLDVIEPPSSPDAAGGGPVGLNLHGGNTPYDPGQFYQWENSKMYNGLVVVAYNLADVGPGDGGFGCVPGSHKANHYLPEAFRNSGKALSAGVAVASPAPAGSAIIFTEALTHGTLPWRAKHQRRTLFYKYHQPMMAWLNYDDTGYSKLREQEGEERGKEWAELLEPPYIGRA